MNVDSKERIEGAFLPPCIFSHLALALLKNMLPN